MKKLNQKDFIAFATGTSEKQDRTSVSSRFSTEFRPEQREKKPVSVEVFTGIRPTGDLTVGNYLGAVQPLLELQEQGKRPFVFVADFHAMTDHEPRTVRKFSRAVVADYLASGLDPEKCEIFIQSSLGAEISLLSTYLARLISVAELLRVPTLKDKIRGGGEPESANALLLLYPVMMAADILIQRAPTVPVGEDQVAHLEIARELVRRFNRKYGHVFPEPKPLIVKPLRILSLKGEGKMSKTNPAGAIFLTDSQVEVANKIKGAVTANPGEMSDHLRSHLDLITGLDPTSEEKTREIIAAHMRGEKVMGIFKQLMTEVVTKFINDFQRKRALVTENPEFINRILQNGNNIAKINADETIRLVHEAMFRVK